VRAQVADIIQGVTPAAVRTYVGEFVKAYEPALMIHPGVGRFGALLSCVGGGVSPF
jgi:hypothetical protein